MWGRGELAGKMVGAALSLDALWQKRERQPVGRGAERPGQARDPAGTSGGDTVKQADAFEQDKPIWVVPEEKARLDAMQESLKSDYLFVIWGYNLSRETAGFGNNTTYSITALGNLFQYPGGRPVSFTYDQNDRSMSFLAIFKGDAYDIEKLLRDSAERITEKFIKATNTGK